MNTMNQKDAQLKQPNQDAGRSDLQQDAGAVTQQESKRKPGIIRRFIDKLADDNSQALGSSRLDCCDLNKNNR